MVLVFGQLLEKLIVWSLHGFHGLCFDVMRPGQEDCDLSIGITY